MGIYINIIFRTGFFYFYIILLYRIMGKREVGQLSITDLIVSMMFSEIAIISIENYKSSILLAIVPISIIAIFQIGLSFLSLKSVKFRETFDGKPSLIINKGKVMFKEMEKQRYNLDDLLVQLREQSIKNIEDIEYAILESSGNLSIFKYNNNESYFPLPIVIDGLIQKDIITNLNKTEDWIYKMLEKEKVELKNVFYAFYKENKTFIIKKDYLD